MLYMHHLISFLPQPYKVETVIVPIFQIRKLRLREAKRPALGHAAVSLLGLV